MRLTLIAATASLAIATAACQKTADTDADAATNDLAANDMATESSMANDMNMSNGAAPMMAGDFASTIAGSDMFELETGKLAQTMATNAELKSFGGMLVTDHTKSSTELKAAAASSSPPVALPTALPGELQGKLDALKAAKGAAFDKLFLEQQREGHQKALETLQSYASTGDAPSLKAFAGKAAPVVKVHLDRLNGMKL